MNENYFVIVGKNQIRLSWQISDMQTIAVTKAVSDPAD